MTATAEPDGLTEFAAELKLLAEAVLERVEPVLRRAAADGKPEWDNCSWCPVCAAAALVRGEQHDVLSAIADHGTAIVTVLREALAGVPVEPVMPDGTEPGVRHRHDAAGPDGRRDSSRTGTPADAVREDIRSGATPAGSVPAPGVEEQSGADESGRSEASSAARSGAPEPGTGTDAGAGAAESGGGKRSRSRYVGIPVTIKT
ncbi:hypothetical protein OG935_12635 [Nocardia cyriacigeorgica]|uniref:hypothetical protein n=1 Tax=Nocardia cyriacigeorgica TaxID=135487 RepID=UPI001E61291B|nr:hypothetical protein [Nocardia cyriacigeorgica]